MDGTDPLSQLADIHLPDPIGFWPPAPGWWILFFLLCAIIYFGGKRFYAGWKTRRACNFALLELDKSMESYRASVKTASPENLPTLKLDFVNELNGVLRRVALKNFPQYSLAKLSGEQWIGFLRDQGDASLLDDELANTLSQGRFAKQWDVDEQRLYSMAHKWISSLYLAKIDNSSKSTETSTPVTDNA
ncbi:MAG: DUF4381 domain-containing protein [Gammaproteobacteria bacterium]